MSTGGLEEAHLRLGYVRLANTVPRFPTWGAGAKPLLGSAITVPWLPTGGAGVKPLLGSANTVRRQVRVRLGQVRLG